MTGDTKYELRELWELTDDDRQEIYAYAMQRSSEIVAAALADKDEEDDG